MCIARAHILRILGPISSRLVAFDTSSEVKTSETSASIIEMVDILILGELRLTEMKVI